MRVPLDVLLASLSAGLTYVHLNIVSRHFGAETKMFLVAKRSYDSVDFTSLYFF